MTENELSNIVLGEAIKVHKHLGPGLLESVYESCLVFHLFELGLKIERQKPIPLVYHKVKLDCGFRCDIIVENKLVIEVKAVDQLNEVHIAQVLTYLKLTGVRLGLLVNFNVLVLKQGIRRVVNNL
jgi:GxxExxY protein